MIDAKAIKWFEDYKKQHPELIQIMKQLNIDEQVYFDSIKEILGIYTTSVQKLSNTTCLCDINGQ